MNMTGYVNATPIEQKSIYDELKHWVLQSYKQYATGWTYERSEGNCCDCFEDGAQFGESWAAYEVGSILGMDLPEPEWEVYDD